jgi:Tripartite tricarboxylate transporter family receptor
VRIIVGFPAGGAPDLFARLIGEWLPERLGRPFAIENRPGAATNIATELVVRAAPDGYTLLLVASANVISATLYPDTKFNLVRDIAPVASIGSLPLVMMVNPSFPAKTVPEFIAYAKAHPGQINVASTGTENLTYMAAERRCDYLFGHLVRHFGRRSLRCGRGSGSMGGIRHRFGDVDWRRTGLMRSHVVPSCNNRSDSARSSAR